ncbi:hypothetical protein Mal15_22050 [Stieleria maiorica]|uniref:Uncharacterized protein n=1 Tax=Stieleria maiorica TaxID=2795974 RepID=A0A5B9MGC7_9BACT|nr:hypothetical protein [Stieleria maiorica]QEF98157.1 hypothetical protein Mal15_22050 [Stieleria maiorica]
MKFEITKSPHMFRAGTVASDKQVGVDRKSNVIRGYAVAEEGRTKTPGRGEFDLESLETLKKLGNADPRGVRIRFQHPSMSDDGLGKFMGRAKNFRIDKREGRHILRADAHIDKTAMEPGPDGSKARGAYLMDLAESDPGAFQSSVVITTDKLEREPDEDGNRRPPLFRPTKFWATDFVDEGDAVHGDIFSSEESLDEFFEGSARRLPSKIALAASQYLDQIFPDSDREVVESRFNAFRDRYLLRRYGSAEFSIEPEDPGMDQETKDALNKTNEALESLAKSTTEKLSELTELISQDRAERKAELSASERASEITGICEMSGCVEKGEAAKWIADDKMSAGDVRKILFGRMCEKNKPVGDDKSDKFSTKKAARDENEKFRQEYAEHQSIHEQLGVSIDRYIAERREEEGLPVQESAAA